MQILKPIIAIMVTLLVLDYLWLGVVSKKFIKNQLGSLLMSSIKWVPTILVYVLLVAGIFIFVLNNPFSKGPWSTMLIGAIFGIIIYGVYDLTNLGTLKNWPLKLVFVDILWGGFIGALASFVGSKFL